MTFSTLSEFARKPKGGGYSKVGGAPEGRRVVLAGDGPHPKAGALDTVWYIEGRFPHVNPQFLT